MKTGYSHGHDAEKVAADYLQASGFAIRGLNWRTKWCEIDIVAEKDKRVYFVEVKYRQKNMWGQGLDYITSKKLERMLFAAELWVSQNRWRGDYQLSAIELSGDDPVVTNFLEDL